MDRKKLREEFLAALSGAGQGAAMDLGDEIYGAARGGMDSIKNDQPFKDSYEKRRDEARGFLRGMEERNPVAYGAGDLVGSMLPIPGAGPIGAGKPLLKRVLRSAAEGGISGFGRSEGESPEDILADAASGAASGAGSTLFFDQMMRKIGDVIDFKKMKKMKDKMRAESIASGIDEVPEGTAGKYSGNLGNINKERMAENNRRAMQEAKIRPAKDFDMPEEVIRPSKGNVTSIDGRPLPTGKQKNTKAMKDKPFEIASDKPEVEPGLWDSIMAKFDDDNDGGRELMRLMNNVEKKGADEPYVGRDFHNVMAVENPRNNKYPQPLPVPIEKIGDLKGVLGKGVLKGDSDPFGWMDTKYGVGKGLLERERDKPLKIYTRSDLIAHDDYMEHINPKLHEVNIVFGSPNNGIGRIMEPGAPSIKRRIQAANKLADKGVKVNFVYQTYDNPNLSEKFKTVGQPPMLDTLRSLREDGLNPSIKVIEERTPIADKNAKNIMKIFGK